MTAPAHQRVCPLCDTTSNDATCASCAVPTVAAELFQEKSGVIDTGVLIAGRYKVESVLGKGGMGAVYKATQLAVNRPVAIKTLLRDLVSDPKNVKRFYREAQAASQLDHPNVVRIFDFGIDDTSGTPFIVMEFLEGISLRQLIATAGMLDEKRACQLLSQVCKALIEAHDKGLVHRDLKPDNIHVRRLPDGDEHCKVLDFGLAKVVSGAQADQGSLTGGAVLGTPLYMSPEQIQQSEELDFRSDLYSLGCILHQMLTGRAPFAGHDHMAVVVKHINDAPPGLPEELSNGKPPSKGLLALHKALLSKVPKHRAGSTAAAAKAFSALARGEDADIRAILADGLPMAPQPNTIDLGIENVQPSVPTEHAGISGLPPKSTAATQYSSGEKKGGMQWALVAVVLLLAGGVAAFVMSGDGNKAPAPGPETVKTDTAKPEAKPEAKPAPKPEAKPAAASTAEAKPAPKPEAKPEVTPEPKPEAKPTAVAEPEPKPAPKPEPRKVTLKAEPAAKVLAGDKELGTTPYEVTLPQGDATLELTLQAEGFEPQSVTLKADSEAPASIVLEKKAAAPVASKKKTRTKKKRTKKRKADPVNKKKPGIQIW